MNDGNILNLLSEHGIDVNNPTLYDLLTAFKLGFDHGWWLVLDLEIGKVLH